MGSKIISFGSYLPTKIVTNAELIKTLDTTEEWIENRTGILHRHIAQTHELTSDLALQAALQAIERAKIDKEQIDTIIVATTTPDQSFPSTATKLQGYLQIKNCAAFDLQAVCAGFVYGIHVANSLIKAGMSKKILLVGAEKMSSIVDWQDKSTAILFGDGAGAVIISSEPTNASDIIDSKIYSDGSLHNLLYTEDNLPIESQNDKLVNDPILMTNPVGSSIPSGKIKMQGREVYRHAIEKMTDAIAKLLQKNNLTIDDIDLIVPHQANIRIIQALANKLKIDLAKVVQTVSVHANCSAASIPLALAVAYEKDLIKRGDLVITTAIGAGLAWGAAIIRY